jgi:class 3 adenylate cyclase
MFMKSTGDGFLAVFSSLPSAFSLALSFLKKPAQADVQSWMALHWGAVKVAPDGDVLGVEVHRGFRAEGVQMQDQVDPNYDGPPIPISDRIVMTEQAMNQLSKTDQAKFSRAGQYELKGFAEPCELWVLHKRL